MKKIGISLFLVMAAVVAFAQDAATCFRARCGNVEIFGKTA